MIELKGYVRIADGAFVDPDDPGDMIRARLVGLVKYDQLTASEYAAYAKERLLDYEGGVAVANALANAISKIPSSVRAELTESNQLEDMLSAVPRVDPHVGPYLEIRSGIVPLNLLEDNQDVSWYSTFLHRFGFQDFTAGVKIIDGVLEPKEGLTYDATYEKIIDDVYEALSTEEAVKDLVSSHREITDGLTMRVLEFFSANSSKH